MKRNIGRFDRLIRIALAILLALGVLSNNILGIWAYAAVVVGFLLFVTALYGVSPTYSILNISTIKK